MGFAVLSRKARYGIIKLIAPKFYKQIKFSYPRPMIKHIASLGWKNVVGAEIGTWKGLNAEGILKLLDIKKLFLIDPYYPYEDGDGVFRDFSSDYEKTRRKFRKYGERVVFIKHFSIDAVDKIPDCLDFVYIDGNHSFFNVWHDITDYYPKIRSGGIIGGHDFNVVFKDVAKAVLKFSVEKGLEVHGAEQDWWITK